MRQLSLLDTFCGAGGAATGYQRAGFQVTGVDIHPQPHYPFPFAQADALEYIADHGHEYDVIHASPPCQAYSRTRYLPNARSDHPRLVAPTRQVLQSTGKPYVIEMVTPKPLQDNVFMLCGTMFGLPIFRHRYFETSEFLLAPPHAKHDGITGAYHGKGGGKYYCVAGHGHLPKDRMANWNRAMGIDWMTRAELTQAIPPAYTQWLASQLLYILGGKQ